MQRGDGSGRRPRQRAPTAAVALVLVLAATLGEPSVVDATTPDAWAAAQHLAETEGGTPDEYHLVYQRPTTLPGSGAQLWAGKFVGPDGDVRTVYRDASGALGGPELLDAGSRASAAAMPAFDRKADFALRRAVAAAPGQESLPVAVWLATDASSGVQAVVARHPELTWIGDRPLVDDLATVRTIRAELWQARHDAYASVQSKAQVQVEALGGTLAYASTSAPLVFVDLAAGRVAELADEKGVTSIGLEQAWEPTMTTAGRTVQADWTSGSGDQGTGVRYAVVEYHNVRNSGDLAGKVVSSHSTSGTLAYTGTGAFDHPTWVAGAVAGKNATYRGVAPGALIISSGTGGYTPSLTYDRAVIAAADWAISPGGGDADIVNTSLVQDTATGAEEARRYFDSIVAEDGRLAVSAAGNYVNFSSWTVGSPGRSWNVLTVGGTDDRGTAALDDDGIWYVPGSNGSSYVDPSGTAWNAHGDFNKPNLSAPAVSVRTANGLAASGTSVATPIVGGIAAQLIARAPALAIWPEAVRALLMAGAFQHAHMPDGSRNADHEGVGVPSALWSNRILGSGDGQYGGYQIGATDGSPTVQQQISVQAGELVRVAASWNSHTSGSSDLTKSDALLTDFDLQVVQPGGKLVGSYTFDNNYEVVEFTAASSGTATIRLPADPLAAGGERYALAWSKIPGISASGPFTDINSSSFRNDILFIYSRGVTAGCTATTYCPDANVSRDQMASFLVRALNLPATSTDYFDDDNGSIHEGNINRLAAAGVTVGCAVRRYCPKDPVNRDQMASFLVRAFHLPASSIDAFTDDNGNQHENNINALAASGITGGCAPGKYCPQIAVTRGQMAAFLHRAILN